RAPRRCGAGPRAVPARARRSNSTPARTGRQDSRARQGRGQRWPRASRENVAVRAPPGNGAFPVYPGAHRMSDARADFLARAARGGMVPVLREVVLDGDTPLAAFVKVARPPFAGGAVGYLGYDLVRTVERLPHAPADTLGVPDAIMMIADTLVILDNLFGRAIVVANVEVPPGAPPAERLRLYDAAVARVDD